MKTKVFRDLMNMKIILTIININLILSFGEANKYVVTRFPELSILYFHLRSLGPPILNEFQNMNKEHKTELCKDVFSSSIFMDKDDTEKHVISTIIQPIIARIINNMNPRVVIRNFLINDVFRGSDTFLLCHSSEEIELYISSDYLTEKRYFVLFMCKNQGIETIKLLGFVEPISNSPSKISRGSDKDYLEQKERRIRNNIHKMLKYFYKFYEDEALRLCSVVFGSVQSQSDNLFKSFIVEAINITYKDDDTSPLLELHSESIVHHKIPLMECAVRQYPSGSDLPPFIFYVTPSFKNLADLFLLVGINYNTYKLEKHLKQVSPVIRENEEFRKRSNTRSASGFLLMHNNY